MIPPSQKRPSAWRQGIIQIWITRACDNSCAYCTQGSNLRSRLKENMYITLDNYETAVKSLVGYFGVVGMFGGNPALHPQFETLCEILKAYIPFEQRGIWCNNPLKHGTTMRNTFDPSISNLNVHGDLNAYEAFKKEWPEARPVGKQHSMHSPVYGTPPIPEEHRWEYIKECDINKYWSAMIGQFRGQPRAWFCEIAGSQAMLHQHIPDYPDTGNQVVKDWWKAPIEAYAHQIKQHCMNCLVPYRLKGMLDNSDAAERTTVEYHDIYLPKKAGKAVDIMSTLEQLEPESVKQLTDYIGNAK